MNDIRFTGCAECFREGCKVLVEDCYASFGDFNMYYNRGIPEVLLIWCVLQYVYHLPLSYD